MDGMNDKNDVSGLENRKNQSFNLIIGIATLLIALLGATFAYFTADIFKLIHVKTVFAFQFTNYLRI